MKHFSAFILSHLSSEKFNSHLGLMEYDFFDLPVPTCMVETILGGFNNSTFNLKHYCSHVGHFSYFIWWLLEEPFVCVNEKIYSKNAKSNSVMEGSLKPVYLPSASGNCFRIASTTHAGMIFLLFLPSLS